MRQTRTAVATPMQSSGGGRGIKDLRKEMPTFTPKNAPPFDPRIWRLRVGGLVKEHLSFSIKQIMKMEKAKLECDFECVEGWTVPRNMWEGVRLRTILEAAGSLPEAGFVMVIAGSFSTCIPLEKALKDENILAYSLNGSDLAFEHGAPLRLIFPQQDCFDSVKWVNNLELLPEYRAGTGKTIALKRIGR